MVLDGGAVAGYQLQDVRVIVYDGKYHPVDSKEVAFVAAGKKAFLDAIGKARPILLEPVVNLDVIARATHGRHHRRPVVQARAHQRHRSLRGGELVVKAQVPLAEVGDYSNELKALTGGRGRYSIEFSHYDPVPPNVQKQLVEAWKPRVEED
jgi:elongation factor G